MIEINIWPTGRLSAGLLGTKDELELGIKGAALAVGYSMEISAELLGIKAKEATRGPKALKISSKPQQNNLYSRPYLGLYSKL